MNTIDIQQEFDRQVQNLLDKKYPELAQLSETEFSQYVEPLKTKLKNQIVLALDLEIGTLPFVIVVKNELVSHEKAMAVIDRIGKPGIISMFPVQPKDFHPIHSITIPDSPIYLLLDIDRGKETLNIAPDKALAIIKAQNRSPLTIDEGIAILTQYPEFLMRNNCFSLLGSRGTDKRVPAIWISENRPKLGWCWNGNPHTWLGSASAKERLA